MDTFEIKINEKSAKGKYILNFLKENKVKVKDPTKMTKKEYYKMLDESKAQAERGEVFELKPENFKKFLGLEQ